MVIAHTDCRMVAGSDDELRRAIRESGGPETADLSFSTSADQAASVCADVDRVRSFARLETLQVGGFVYDVTTGAHTNLLSRAQACGMVSSKRAPLSLGS